jgi:hypothetical protein
MALPPQPHLRRGVELIVAADFVDLVRCVQFARAVHDLPQDLAALATRQPLGNRFFRNLVRRLGRDLKFLRPAIHQQVAVAHAGVELEPGEIEIAGQFGNVLLRLGIGYATGRVVFHDAVGDGDEVAAKHPVARRQRNVLGRRLQRRSAGVIDVRVIPQETHRGDIRSRLKPVRHRARRPLPPEHGHAIHVRRLGNLQRRLPPQLRQRIISRPVGDDDGVFHSFSKSPRLARSISSSTSSGDSKRTGRTLAYRAKSRSAV